jgi:hypothetical protein
MKIIDFVYRWFENSDCDFEPVKFVVTLIILIGFISLLSFIIDGNYDNKKHI